MASTPFARAARERIGRPLLLAWLLAFPISLLAAGPTNDVCAGAMNIPGAGIPGPAPFPIYLPVVNITQATNKAGQEATLVPLCQSSVSHGIWYKFRPVSNANYSVTTCAPATTVDDTVVAIYTSVAGCAGPFVSVACNDDDACSAGGLQSSITTLLLADTDYYIVVWAYDDGTLVLGSKTNVQVIVDKPVPPGNDTCSTAEEIFLNTPVARSTVLATNNYQLGNTNAFSGVGQQRTTNSFGRDVVFKFTAPDTADYSFKVFDYKDASGFDLLIYVAGYCAPGSNPQFLTNCLAASTRSRVSTAEEIMCLPLTNGQLVYIYVDDTNFNGGSSFVVEATRCNQEAEPNGLNSIANPIACGIEGTISPSGDSDFFAVGSFPAGSRLFALVDGAAAATTEFDLRATSLTDTLEYDDQDNDSRFGANSPNISGAMLPGGPAFLRVNGAGTLEPYRLYAVVQPPLLAAAVEIEGSTNSSPLNYFYGTLPTNNPPAAPLPSADVDLYTFWASDGDLVFVSLDGDPSRDGSAVNAQLELLDAFGNSLVVVNDVRGISDVARTTNNLNAVMPNTPGEALAYRCAEGTYFVRVSIGATVTGPSGAGDYLLSIAKNCIPGETGFNTPPVIENASVTSPVSEGAGVTLSGTVMDPDVGDAGTLVVDWGDGNSDVLNFATAGMNEFSLNHTYPPDSTTGTASRMYSIELILTDKSGESASTGRMAIVTNRPPAALTLMPDASAVVEGATVALDGTFADDGALDAHTITIDWGDGSAATVLNPAMGARAFNSSHQYLDDKPSATPADSYQLTVTVADDDGAATSATLAITVNNVSPSLLNIAVTSPVAVGSNAVLSGTIADTALDSFTLNVDWGDGSPSQNFSYPAGTTAFSANHAYASGNTNFTINLLLQDDDSGSASASTSVQVQANAEAARFIGITRLGNGHMLLELQGTPQAVYRIVASSNLTSWSEIGTATASGSGAFSFEDETPPPGSRFYRALALP